MRTLRFLTLSLFVAAPAAAFTVTYDPLKPRPGDVLRVEVVGIETHHRVGLSFRGRDYPLYAVAPGRMRALIGLTAKAKRGEAELEVVRRRFLLPDQTLAREFVVVDRKFSHQHIRMPKKKTKLARKKGARKATQLIRKMIRTESPLQYFSGPLLRPSIGRRSSRYGHTRTINKTMKWPWHMGIDIAAPDGTEVIAPSGGTVRLTGRFPVQGGTLVLDHGQGLASAFLHLAAFLVDEGTVVRKGDPIARVGGGGFSTGSHLHWGVYVHGAPVDPEPLMERPLD